MRGLLLLIVVVRATSDILGVDIGLAPGLSAKNLLLYVGFGLLLLQKAVTRKPRLQIVGLQGLFLFMVAYAIGTVVFNVMVLELPGYSPIEQAIGLKTQLVDYFILFVLFFYAARTEADVRAVLSCLLGAVALASLFTITNVFGLTNIGQTTFGHNNDIEGGRVYGYFGHANETGTLLATLIPAFFAMVESARPRLRLLWLGGLAASALMLLMTGSRGAMVGFLVGGGVTAFAYRQYFDRKRVRYWLILAVTVMMPLMLVVGWEYLQTLAARLEIQATGRMADASSGRTDLWSDALGIMMDSPWTLITGFGWGGWDNHNFRYVAHNSYLQYWFDLGLPGLLGLLLVITGSMAVVRKSLAGAQSGTRAIFVGYQIGMASLLVALVFLNLYTPWPYLWAYMGLVMRLAIIVRTRERESLIAREPAGTPIMSPSPTAMRRV